MKIEEMHEKHIKQIADLEKICFSQPWSENGLSEEINNETARFFVCEENEKVLAYAGMHLVCGEGYVTNIAVFPEYRKMSLATKLIEKMFSICKISLSLEVRESNEKATNLYKKLAFKNLGKRKNFYDNPVENGLIYTKERT
ncbi:MAG: ribosomal protein S18-alanine N-acetyltransferase [Clostridia bacterium]